MLIYNITKLLVVLLICYTLWKEGDKFEPTTLILYIIVGITVLILNIIAFLQ